MRMVRVPLSYRDSEKYKSKLDGYMCDRCGERDLLVDRKKADGNGAFLYWLETGNQPFDGAVCCDCYVADPITKRRRGKKTVGGSSN